MQAQLFAAPPLSMGSATPCDHREQTAGHGVIMVMFIALVLDLLAVIGCLAYWL